MYNLMPLKLGMTNCHNTDLRACMELGGFQYFSVHLVFFGNSE